MSDDKGKYKAMKKRYNRLQQKHNNLKEDYSNLKEDYKMIHQKMKKFQMFVAMSSLSDDMKFKFLADIMEGKKRTKTHHSKKTNHSRRSSKSRRRQSKKKKSKRDHSTDDTKEHTGEHDKVCCKQLGNIASLTLQEHED